MAVAAADEVAERHTRSHRAAELAVQIFGPRTVAVQAGEVSVKQAAADLGIPADAVCEWLRLGQVPARRGPSGRWCIR